MKKLCKCFFSKVKVSVFVLTVRPEQQQNPLVKIFHKTVLSLRFPGGFCRLHSAQHSEDQRADTNLCRKQRGGGDIREGGGCAVHGEGSSYL